MLYLLLVVVFSDAAKRWWMFALIGWGKCYKGLVTFCAIVKCRNCYIIEKQKNIKLL